MKNKTTAVHRGLLVFLLLLAMGLRFYRLNAQSFWNDEGNSARLSERSIRLIIEGTASDIHPPVYYLILRGWRELVGETEFGLRSFSAFMGLLTIPLTYRLARSLKFGGSNKYSRKRVINGSMIAALLTAVNPTLIYYSQETRMYAMLAAITVLSILLLIKWLQDGSPFWLSIALILSGIAGLYTHYFYPVVLIIQNLILLVWLIGQVGRNYWDRNKALIIHWFVIMSVTFLLYLPWLPIFIRQAGVRESFRIPFLEFIKASGRWLLFGPTIELTTIFWPFIAGVLLLLMGIAAGGWRSLLAVLGLGGPILFMYVTGTTRPEFYKFLLISAPFLGVLAGIGWNWDGRFEKWVRPLLFIPLFIVFWGINQSLSNLYTNPAYARADYRGMAARIAAENRPNAGIILSAPNQWEVFTYYHQEGAPVYPIPTSPATADQIDAELKEITAVHDRIYAIFWGELQQDPEGLVEQWLDTHLFKATDDWVGDVRFVTYAVPGEFSTRLETPLNVRFGDNIVLKGLSIGSTLLFAGDVIQVTLFWESIETVDQRFKLFLHLVDSNSIIVTQQDSEPAGGSNPTTSWKPGKLITDNEGVLIPRDTPAGDYQLLLGLYEIGDPSARLPIFSADGITDTYPLVKITIK